MRYRAPLSFVVFTAVVSLAQGCSAEVQSEDLSVEEAQRRAPAMTGLDVLDTRFASGDARMAGGIDLRGKRIALVVNQTAVTASGKHAIDVFRGASLDVVKIFGPEHGARGEEEAGKPIQSGRDRTGVPIVSLYGAKKKPSPQDLADVDVIFFDIQDVGARLNSRPFRSASRS